MTETITFSRILREDLDLGNGSRSLRLQDGSLHTLTQIQGHTLIQATKTISATAGVSTLSASGLIIANARVFGVTIKITTGLGNGNGLTEIAIGDPVFIDRWGAGVAIALNTETSQGDFTEDEPVIYPAATNVVITGDNNFDGTGAIEVCCHYMMLTHPS